MEEAEEMQHAIMQQESDVQLMVQEDNEDTWRGCNLKHTPPGRVGQSTVHPHTTCIPDIALDSSVHQPNMS